MKIRSSSARWTGAGAILCSVVILAPPRAADGPPQDRQYEMGTFYLCLLVKGPNWTAEQTEGVHQAGEAHIKHIQSLVASGKGVIAGPFTDDGRIRGIVVLNAASPEEALALEEADPAVKAGRFSVEVLKWWAAKGIMKPPQEPLKMTSYYLAFLRRGPKWTAEKTAETEKLQADHMANINKMARAGKLVIAGPFENAGDHAGVFVFKVDSIEEAKALAESDPSVKVGRLAFDVHPWMVPQGSLP